MGQVAAQEGAAAKAQRAALAGEEIKRRRRAGLARGFRAWGYTSQPLARQVHGGCAAPARLSRPLRAAGNWRSSST
jgi:hypothetical protein